MYAKSLQSCPTLCNPMDYSLSGSSVHGVSQARTLEWTAEPSAYLKLTRPCNHYISIGLLWWLKW